LSRFGISTAAGIKNGAILGVATYEELVLQGLARFGLWRFVRSNSRFLSADVMRYAQGGTTKEDALWPIKKTHRKILATDSTGAKRWL